MPPFQSTLSVRRATLQSNTEQIQALFQSTLSVRRATHNLDGSSRVGGISIHALRKESDLRTPDAIRHRSMVFQSTLSVRRATRHVLPSSHCKPFQSTLSVRRATRLRLRLRLRCQQISIHALRKESDVYRVVPPQSSTSFQSTLSVRRATPERARSVDFQMISIHALRKESDRASSGSTPRETYFNPRSP